MNSITPYNMTHIIYRYQLPEYNNFVHPTAIIGDDVSIGKNNYIGPYCIIYGGTIIGDNNRFESNVIIGSNAEHKEFLREGSKFNVEIGNNNIFREFVTINAGTTQDTLIGNDNIMLRNSHLGHDSRMMDNITLSCNVLVGGHSIIMDGVNMGLGSICHQYSVLGAYSMIGMGGIVTKKTPIESYYIYVGNPVKKLKYNNVGVDRANICASKYMDLDILYKLFTIKE